MSRVCAALVALVLLAGCSDPNKGKLIRILEAEGYTNIQLGGYAFFMCGQDDLFATSFTATGPTGQPVSGAICSGVTKGATVRLR